MVVVEWHWRLTIALSLSHDVCSFPSCMFMPCSTIISSQNVAIRFASPTRIPTVFVVNYNLYISVVYMCVCVRVCVCVFNRLFSVTFRFCTMFYPCGSLSLTLTRVQCLCISRTPNRLKKIHSDRPPSSYWMTLTLDYNDQLELAVPWHVAWTQKDRLP